MNLQKLVDIAHGVALAGPGVGGKSGSTFRLGALLINPKGHIVQARYNELKTHPFLKQFTPYPYLHSETNCLIHQGLDNCKDYTLLVIRCLRNGKLANAKPCETCAKLIKIAGISKVFYTNQNGELTCA